MSAHGAKRPQPLLTRAGIVTTISVLAALLVHVAGGSWSAWLAGHADELAAVLLSAGPLVTAALSRLHVTPVADPRAADGSRLVRYAETVESTVRAAVAEAEAIHPQN